MRPRIPNGVDWRPDQMRWEHTPQNTPRTWNIIVRFASLHKPTWNLCTKCSRESNVAGGTRVSVRFHLFRVNTLLRFPDLPALQRLIRCFDSNNALFLRTQSLFSGYPRVYRMLLRAQRVCYCGTLVEDGT